MKTVWKVLVFGSLVTAGAVSWFILSRAPYESYPGHPVRGGNMIYKHANPEPTPKRVQIFSTLKEGDKDRMEFVPKAAKKFLRLETRDEAAIRSLVEAMREGADKTVHPPLKDVVPYHIYFESSEEPKATLYYIFYYQRKTNEPSALTAYSTVGNLCNAEAVERWFETNGVLWMSGRE